MGQAFGPAGTPDFAPALRKRVPDGPQEIAKPERLGEPAASALIQELLGVGSRNVARHENDAPLIVGAASDSVR